MMDALAHYARHLAGEKGASPHTRIAAERDLALLTELAGTADLARLTPVEIRSFVRQLSARGLSGRSIARVLSTWRSFYRVLCRDAGWPMNPVSGVRPPKSPKKLPGALTVDDAAGFLDNLPDDDALAIRDKAIFELAYSSGLRVAELVSLRLTELDLTQGLASVTGKGNKTRIVPVGSVALEALRQWLAQRGNLAQADVETVFVGKTGRPLTTRAVEARLKTWQMRLGLPGNLYPHKLRHSCASHLLQSSGDLRAVQELLGHASIATTQIYTQLDFQHLAKTYDAAHPRARRRDQDD
jgi:integrase/recombinase XerC